MASIVARRNFLKGLVVTVGAVPLAACGDDESTPAKEPSTDPADQDRVFPQGLASGDPKPASVILWVRVEPEDETGAIPLTYELSKTDDFAAIVASGDLEVDESTGHTLRLKVTELEAFTIYYYRFTSRDVMSPTGRTKTAPAEGDDVNVRFGFAACQDYIGRYYHSWKAFADEAEQNPVDFVLFLGDYIYETNGDPDFQESGSERGVEIPDGIQLLEDNPDVKAATTVADYRSVYKTYRSDPDLRRAHLLAPFICIWDDHEFANDCWQDHSTDFNEAKGDEKSPDRRHAATQVWFEFQMADVEFDEAAAPPNDIKIYRQLRYGKHLELFMTDQRSYRSDHVIPENATADGKPAGAPESVPTYNAVGVSIFDNSEVFTRNFCIKEGFDPIEAFVKPTMLGDTQKSWFIDAITSSTASWKVWANETQLVQMLLDLTTFGLPDIFSKIYYFTVDQWDGYRTERAEILNAIAGTPNMVALTGDIHAFYAAEIHADPDVLTGDPLMVEYVTAGISSSPVQQIAATVVEGNPAFADLAALVPQFDEILQATSGEYKYANSNTHGVAIVDIDAAAEFKVTFLQIADVKTEDWDGKVTRKSFRTVAGSNKVEAL